MDFARVHHEGRLFIAGLVLLLATQLQALEPPTPAQVRQYQADGTWDQHVAKARAIGNHRIPAELAARTQARIQIEAARAAGLTLPTLMAPPPAWQGGLPAKGTRKVLVICVEFPDYLHDAGDTVEELARKMFGAGDTARQPYESLHNYYARSSYNQLDIQGNVLGWYMASHNRSYYETAGNEALIMEALNYFDTSGAGHDFTQYDNDGDGKIEGLYVKWTGPDNGWANFWWAYQTSWSRNSSYRIDGKRLGSYVWSWIHNINYDGFTTYQPHVDIHETGHMLGLPDYYDYDGKRGPDGGVGGLDMMDANKGDHNCFSKFMLEWLTPTFMTSGTATLALNPTASHPECVAIMPAYAYTPGTTFDEFFMVQYRKRSLPSGDVCNDSTLPTSGYTIWHVDSTLNGTDFAFDNSYTAHKLLRLMEADGLEQIEAGMDANSGDFYRAGSTFTDTSTPNSRNYAGQYTGVSVTSLGTAGVTLSAVFSVSQSNLMEPGGWTLLSENCLPGNKAVDPGETVTINFTLVNNGTTATTNLVGTLRAADGVTQPIAPGIFGVSQPGGVPVTQPFTFTASGNCGDTLTVTLDLQDDATIYPPVSFAIPLGVSDGQGGYTCCHIPNGVGDLDGDGDTDQSDFGLFQICLTATGVTAPAECQTARMDLDLDVDQADLAMFLRCHTQSGVAADPSCRNP